MINKWKNDLEFREKQIEINKKNAKKRVGKKGVCHSEETKNKLSEFCRGKTYEEIYGEEKAIRLKRGKQKQFINNNPNKVIRVIQDYLDIIQVLMGDTYIRLSDIRCKFSLYIKRSMIQEIFETTNIQIFRNEKNESEIKMALKRKKYYYENIE